MYQNSVIKAVVHFVLILQLIFEYTYLFESQTFAAVVYIEISMNQGYFFMETFCYFSKIIENVSVIFIPHENIVA